MNTLHLKKNPTLTPKKKWDQLIGNEITGWAECSQAPTPNGIDATVKKHTLFKFELNGKVI